MNRLLVEGAGAGIAFFDPSGTILHVNAIGAALAGGHAVGFIGRSLRGARPPPSTSPCSRPGSRRWRAPASRGSSRTRSGSPARAAGSSQVAAPPRPRRPPHGVQVIALDIHGPAAGRPRTPGWVKIGDGEAARLRQKFRLRPVRRAVRPGLGPERPTGLPRRAPVPPPPHGVFVFQLANAPGLSLLRVLTFLFASVAWIYYLWILPNSSTCSSSSRRFSCGSTSIAASRPGFPPAAGLSGWMRRFPAFGWIGLPGGLRRRDRNLFQAAGRRGARPDSPLAPPPQEIRQGRGPGPRSRPEPRDPVRDDLPHDLRLELPGRGTQEFLLQLSL